MAKLERNVSSPYFKMNGKVRVHRRNGLLFCILFGGLFAAAGAFMLWIAVLHPTIQIVQALNWASTPCTILSSELVGKDTFQIAIRYEYEAQGAARVGDRYSFATLKTSGRNRKQQVVDQYPAGSQAVCFVNPWNPNESVLNRGFVPQMWWGAMSIPFLGVGVLFGYVLFFTKKTPVEETPAMAEWDPVMRRLATSGVEETSDSDYDTEDLAETASGPVTLSAQSTRLGEFFGMLLATLFWNGILSLFLFDRLDRWMKGQWAWFPELFLAPFVLIGLILVLATFRSFLALFNPAPALTLSRQRVPLGGTAQVSWKFVGATRAIRGLKIVLKGTEIATYTRGTNTSTDTAVFHEETVFETHQEEEVTNGTTELRVPGDTMHSFQSLNNKIQWQLEIQGDIAFWPDVFSVFPIQVAPHE